MIIYSNKSVKYTIRTKTHQGKKFIIVPVVMMVEGVHSGSHGPVLHTADELGKYPQAWDGIPIVVNHPQDQDGNYISANSPQIIDNESVGRVYNSTTEDKKLKAEAWLDEEKLKQVSPVALAYIKQGNPLDVSIGCFTDDEKVEGEYEGENYQAIARNHRPDHLALLPGAQGACSWDDGCGIRVNHNKSNKKKGGFSVNEEEILKEKQDALSRMNVNIAQSLRETMDKAYQYVNSLDSTESYHYLEDVYDSFIIYGKNVKDGGQSMRKLYKQHYTLNGEGQIEAVGDPVEVVKSVSYNPVPTANTKQRTKGAKTMSEGKSACSLAKVEKIINSNQNGFGESDKEYLLTQDEAVLDKLMPKEVHINADQAVQVLKNTFKTAEDVIKLAPEEEQAALQSGLKLHKERKNVLVQTIMDNAEKDTWKKEELEAMSMGMLEKISKSIKVPVDYSFQGTEMNTNREVNAPEALLPTGMEAK